MDVRPVRPPDAPLVLALALDDRAQLVRGTTWALGGPAVRTLLRCVLPFPMPGRCWIAHDGQSVALIEAQARRYVIGWDVTRLACQGEPAGVLAAVVCAAVDHLQRRGIPRLFARCREEGLEALQPLDFRPIAREYVLTGPATLRPPGHGSDAAIPLPAGSRYRMPQDAWPLHQLAGAITPPLVRQLEGASSLDWSERLDKRLEIVVERDGQIVAWAGWRTRLDHGHHPLGLIVHPDHADVGADLLTHVLGQVPRGRAVIRLREYQEGTIRLCLDAGFQVTVCETLTVKQGLLAPARNPKRARMARIPTVPAAPLMLCKRHSPASGDSRTRIHKEV